MTITDYEAVFYGSILFAPYVIQWGLMFGAGDLLRWGREGVESKLEKELKENSS